MEPFAGERVAAALTERGVDIRFGTSPPRPSTNTGNTWGGVIPAGAADRSAALPGTAEACGVKASIP
ncbi:hypothetical protein [Nocardia carnea]|uniref:hypothetical protein n=1 Tax=Nocardia carnea TaxID=37328 RepID=UPI003D787D7D